MKKKQEYTVPGLTKKPAKSLDEIVFGSLLEMCERCNSLKLGNCGGIREGQVKQAVIVSKSALLVVTVETMRRPLCPRMDLC